MRKFITALCLINCLNLWAQNDISNKKTWADGPLTWKDFQGKSFKTLDYSFDMLYGTSYQGEKIKLRDTIFVVLRVSSHMNKTDSWINPLSKTQNNLKYVQVLFNHLEIYKRRLQVNLLEIDNSVDAETALNNNERLYREEAEEIKNLTHSGSDTLALDSILKGSYVILRNTPDAFVPSNLEIKSAKHGVSASFWLGYTAFTGQFSQYFRNSFSFFGADINYLFKKSSFGIDVSLGGSQVEAEKNIPAPARALFRQRREGQFFQGFPLPGNAAQRGFSRD